MSINGKKVLQLDRNNYYGSESASLTGSPLNELYRHYSDLYMEAKVPGGRNWHVDLVPKFIMADGELVKFLTYTGATRYLELKNIEESLVTKGGTVEKVPRNSNEILLSSRLMGMFEKRRFRTFFLWAMNLQFDDENTFDGVNPGTTTMNDLFKKYIFEKDTIEFIGHSILLFPDDTYLDQPCKYALIRFKSYYDSMSVYGKSPYLYPLFGLSDIPMAFSRLNSVYGGSHRLDQPVEEILMEGGKVVGVKSNGEIFRSKMIISDPSYFPERVHKVGEVVRAICILDHSIAAADNYGSFQLIIPGNQAHRKNDIYVAVLSERYLVTEKGYYIGYVSTTVETDDPDAELERGLHLLEPILYKFIVDNDIYHPNDDGIQSKIFISKSYDANSNFRTISDDIKDICQRMNILVEGF